MSAPLRGSSSANLDANCPLGRLLAYAVICAVDSSSSVNCDGSTYSDASGWRTARVARRARANFVDAALRLAACVRGAARDAGARAGALATAVRRIVGV